MPLPEDCTGDECDECPEPCEDERLKQQYATKIPYEGLEELITFLSDRKEDFINTGRYPVELGGLVFSRALDWLQELKKLYVRCFNCDKFIAPDQPKIYMKAGREPWCIRCYRAQGI